MSANADLPAHADPAPTLRLMHATFLLAGFGTVLLGPILPLLSQRWHLADSESGLMLLSQFCGATLGGLTVSARLQRGMLLGLLAAAAGFFGFALAPALLSACVGLLVGGFGVGRLIATVNIIAGARYTQNRGSALSRLNFTWSLGALLSPLLAAWLTRFTLATRLATFAALFLVCAIALTLQMRTAPSEAGPAANAPRSTAPLAASVFLYFAILLFVYGGLETCLSAWLTTYALRYGQSSLILSQYTLVLLLCGLTAGRALAAWLLLRTRDTTLQRLALLCSASRRRSPRHRPSGCPHRHPGRRPRHLPRAHLSRHLRPRHGAPSIPPPGRHHPRRLRPGRGRPARTHGSRFHPRRLPPGRARPPHRDRPRHAVHHLLPTRTRRAKALISSPATGV